MKSILFSVLILATTVQAQTERIGTEMREFLEQNGKLFTIQLFPKDRRLTVQLAGEPIADVDPARLKILGRVVAVNGKKLKIVPAQDHFQILNPLNAAAPLEFKVEDKKTHQVETFQFNLN